MSKPFIATITLDGQVTAPGAPVAALAGLGAGNVNSGTHSYKVTFVSASGETEAGTASNVVTTAAGDGQVALSAIPVSTSALVTSRNIYRTEAGGAAYKLLTTIANNTATTFADNVADASLTTAAPSTNTTTAAKELAAALIAAGYAGVLGMAQLILSPVGGTASLSTDADIATEAAGLPLDTSANFYATSMRDPVQTVGQYLFSATVDQQIAVYARGLF